MCKPLCILHLPDLKFYGTSAAASTLVNYSDGSCSGNAGYCTASAGGSYLNASVGDDWNDKVSSFTVFS